MGFYYISIFSIVPLGIAYGLLALIYWGVVRASRGTPARKTILSVVGAVFLVLPVGEELWIAWNFGQACKEAGTFIYKKVPVDGYYNDTGTITRIVGGPSYGFIESRESNGQFRRVERANDEEKARALEWYAERNAGKQKGGGEWITQSVSDRVQVTVETNTGYAWRITKLDRPTARYRYLHPHSHTPVAQKVVKHERLVVDSERNQILGRELSYGRHAPWFFIGLDAPIKICSGKRDVKGSLDENVLLPRSASSEGDTK